MGILAIPRPSYPTIWRVFLSEKLQREGTLVDGDRKLFQLRQKNSLRFWFNGKGRIEHEGVEENFFYMNLKELIFGGVALFLIWIAYALFQYLV